MTNVSSNASELWLQVPGFTDLSLTDVNVDDDGHSFTIRAVAAGSGGDATGWDAPQPVDVAVQRWMTDGAVAVTQGHDNRSPFVNVIVSADTAADLAAGEAALALRSGQPGELLWVPPSGRSNEAPSVFEVWTWHLEHTFDEFQERWLERSYGMRFTAKPWTRSNTITTVDALATVATPNTIEVDACTSLTGWTGTPNTPTLSGGTAIVESRSVSLSDVQAGRTEFALSLTRTGSVTGMTTTPYLVLNVSTAGGTADLGVFVDSVQLTRVASNGASSWWQMPSGVDAFTKLEIDANIVTNTVGTVSLTVNDVSRSDSPGGIGTHMQLFRSIAVGGSVKTSGSLHVASPSSTPLGTVLVYTCKDTGSGYQPPLRQFRTAGNTVTVDSTAVSGAREALTVGGVQQGEIYYQIPAGVLPEGTYAVVGRFYSTAACTLTPTVEAMPLGMPATSTTTGSVTISASGYTWSVVGVLALPPAMPGESNVATRIGMYATSTTGNVDVDELYILDVTHGAVSLVQTKVSNETQLWLDSPDNDPVRNRPAVYIGNNSDRSNAKAAPMVNILALGDHDLDPSGSIVFTVTDGVADAQVDAKFFRRWHTHAGS